MSCPEWITFWPRMLLILCSFQLWGMTCKSAVSMLQGLALCDGQISIEMSEAKYTSWRWEYRKGAEHAINLFQCVAFNMRMILGNSKGKADTLRPFPLLVCLVLVRKEMSCLLLQSKWDNQAARLCSAHSFPSICPSSPPSLHQSSGWCHLRGQVSGVSPPLCCQGDLVSEIKRHITRLQLPAGQTALCILAAFSSQPAFLLSILFWRSVIEL